MPVLFIRFHQHRRPRVAITTE